MNRLPLIAAVLVAFSLTSCSRSETVESPAPATVPEAAMLVILDDWKTYTSKEYGFSFRHPPAWDVGPSDLPNMLLNIYTNREPTDSFCVVGGETSVGGVPKEAFIEEIVDEDWLLSFYGKHYPGVKVTEFRHDRISGYKAIRVEIEYSDVMWEGGPVLVQRHDGFMVFTEDAVHNMGCITAMPAYEQLHPVFTGVLHSFQIHRR